MRILNSGTSGESTSRRETVTFDVVMGEIALATPFLGSKGFSQWGSESQPGPPLASTVAPACIGLAMKMALFEGAMEGHRPKSVLLKPVLPMPRRDLLLL